MNWIILLLLFCSFGNRCCAEPEHECGRHEDCSCKPSPCGCEPCRERDREEGCGRERESRCDRNRDRDDVCNVLRDRDNNRGREDGCGCNMRDRDDDCPRERCDMPGITPPPWNSRNMRGETCGCEE